MGVSYHRKRQIESTPNLVQELQRSPRKPNHKMLGFSINFLRICAYLESRIWRLPEVMRQTGLSRSTIYEMTNRGEFPRQIKLGRRAVGWIANDVLNWIRTKVDSHPNSDYALNRRNLVDNDWHIDRMSIPEHLSSSYPCNLQPEGAWFVASQRAVTC